MNYCRLKVRAVILLTIFTLCIAPVSAVLEETTVDGTISAIDIQNSKITIAVDGRWNGQSWETYSVTLSKNAGITGKVPDGTIFDYIGEGDRVQATFADEDDGTVTWETISKLWTPSTGRDYLSDSWGDPSNVVSPFFNNFGMSYETTANCSECSGSLCSASLASVRITQGWDKKNYAQTATMWPGETLIFTSPPGCISEFQLTFINGEVSSSGCGGLGDVNGSGHISNFEVHIILKGTMTESTLTPTVPVTTVQTELPATESSPGFSLFAAITGLFPAFAAVLRKK